MGASPAMMPFTGFGWFRGNAANQRGNASNQRGDEDVPVSILIPDDGGDAAEKGKEASNWMLIAFLGAVAAMLFFVK